MTKQIKKLVTWGFHIQPKGVEDIPVYVPEQKQKHSCHARILEEQSLTIPWQSTMHSGTLLLRRSTMGDVSTWNQKLCPETLYSFLETWLHYWNKYNKQRIVCWIRSSDCKKATLLRVFLSSFRMNGKSNWT